MEYEKEYLFHVGIDWGTEEYEICMIGRSSHILQRQTVKHTGTAISQFAQDLVKLAPRPKDVAIAIETPRGAMVEALLEHGLHVFSINPKQADRFRDRYTVAGAKDDRLDSFVLADSLRTDLHCLRYVRTDKPLVIQLREMARAGEEFNEEINRLSNRLREQLHRFYPQMLSLCPAADEAWLWDLLEIAPTPAEARKLRSAKVEKLLRRHRIRRFCAEKILEELRAPPLQLAPGSVEACVSHIRLILPHLHLVHKQQIYCTRSIGDLLKRLDCEESTRGEGGGASDVAILLSMKGLGRVTAVTLLTEASISIAERDYDTLRAIAGVAPVSKSSGKDKKKTGKWKKTPGLVMMRRACNIRLRNAIYHWARVAAQRDALCRQHYETLRTSGHKHGRTLRGVADRLLRILVACLKSGTLYDPERLRRKTQSGQAVASGACPDK